jgi:hypothetical protein
MLIKQKQGKKVKFPLAKQKELTYIGEALMELRLIEMLKQGRRIPKESIKD